MEFKKNSMDTGLWFFKQKKLFEKEQDYKKFLLFNAKVDMHTAKFMMRVIVVLELMLMCYTLFFKESPLTSRSTYYLILYVALIIMSVVTLELAAYAKKDIETRYRAVIYMQNIYAVFFVFWGMAISILDMSGNSQGSGPFVYITILIILPVAIYVNLKVLLAVYALSCGMITTAILNFSTIARTSVEGVLINVYCFALVAVCLALIHQFYKIKSYQTNQKILLQNKKLKILSETDFLTGLYNRAAADHILEKLSEDAWLHKTEVGIIFLDIDDFKIVNDKHSHQVGDDCLKTVADIINKVVSEINGYAFRYGGEEFLLALAETSKEETLMIGEMIRKNVQDTKFSNLSKQVTVSLGIHTGVIEEEKSIYDMIQKADKALYSAKATGKNKIGISE